MRHPTRSPSLPRSFTFDVSGYIICRAVFTSEQLVAAEDDLAALAEDETVLAYVQQLGGDAHLPGPPTRPGLDSPPALLRAAAGLQGHDAARDYSKAYVSLPRDGSATQAQRWSCSLDTLSGGMVLAEKGEVGTTQRLISA